MKSIISLLLTLATLSGGYAASANYNPQTNKGEFFRAAVSSSETKYIGEKSTEVWCEDDEYTASYAKTLYKDADRDFVILNIADIHLSDRGYRVFYSVFAEATLRRLVEEVQPDLITLTGDNVCDDYDEYSIRHLTDLMESFGIPWAPVFGNHDDEGNCDLNYLADIMMKSPHCLFSKGDERMGCGNYVINIVEKESGDIVQTLVMADSHHSNVNEIQQEWYAWVCEGTDKISSGKAEVALFQHIPLAQYQYAYDKYIDGNDTPEGAIAGSRHEKICCPRDNDGNPFDCGFFDVIKKSGNTKNVFCGHEHRNDFSVMYEGIRLTYLMKIGKSSGYQPGFDGGSVITVGNSGVKSIENKTKTANGFKTIAGIDCVNDTVISDGIC